MIEPIEPMPPEEQINPEDPFFLLPMETIAEANSRRSRLLNRPASAITEVLRRSLISGNVPRSMVTSFSLFDTHTATE